MQRPGYVYPISDEVEPTFRLAPRPDGYRKSVDRAKLTVTSVLTYPVVDLAGDYLDPAGGDWSLHLPSPAVNLEHNRADVCAWARESLAEPGAPHSVRLKSVTAGGRTWDLPFGVSYFDPNNKLSSQVFRLIDDGISGVGPDVYPGVSLEFRAAPDRVEGGRLVKSYRQLAERSPLENRPAYQFDRWLAEGWAHCAVPVNPGAMTVLKGGPRHEAIARLLSSKKVGGEPAHPAILKSLARYAPPQKSNTVTVPAGVPAPPTGRKAVADTAEPTVYDDATDTGADPAAADEAPEGNPTSLAGNQLAQSLTDVKAQIDDMLKRGEHKAGRKALAKILEQLDALAEKAIGVAQKVDADLADDSGDEVDVEEEPEEKPEMEPDDAEGGDGMLKAIPKTYRKAIKRFRMADLKPAAGAAPAGLDTAAVGKAMKRLLKKLEAL